MAVTLDVKDKKILTLLDENARFSNSQIGRKVKLSKPAVEYRLRRMKDNDVLFGHYAVINFTRLGYAQYKVYFKFQNATLEEEKKMLAYWNKNDHSVWAAQIRGHWDLAVSILAGSNFAFGKILSSFMNVFSQFIFEKDVLLTEYSPIYAREYLTAATPSEFTYGIPSEHYALDETDKKILRALATNARISIIDLASQLKLSRDVITYRLKKLKNEHILVGFRTYPRLEILGVRHYKLILRTKQFNERAENELKSYVKMHKKATQLLKLIGSWDLEIEFEVESEDELYDILNDMKQKFSHIIRDLDIIRILKTIKYTYFPFK